MTVDNVVFLWLFLLQVRKELEMNGIEIYPQKEFDDDMEDKSDNDKIRVSCSVVNDSALRSCCFTTIWQIVCYPHALSVSRKLTRCKGFFYLFNLPNSFLRILFHLRQTFVCRQEAMPFAVVGSDKEYQVNGKRVLGRKTAWGIVEGTYIYYRIYN